MATRPSLLRHYPALLAFTGLAAGYAIFVIYTSLADHQNTTSLRRSNAVHRPRRERQLLSIDSLMPSLERPFGTLVLRRGEDGIVVNLDDLTGLPTADELNRKLGPGSEEIQVELADEALSMVLLGCLTAVNYAGFQAQVDAIGLGGLVAAMAARDEDQIRRQSHDMIGILHLDNINIEQVEAAVDKFLAANQYFRAEASLSEGPVEAAADLAETEELGATNAANGEPSQGLRGLLYYIAEEDAKRKANEHRGIHCEECGERPIRDIRWHCLNCPDFDLCSTCEAHTIHPKTHVFAKIKIPLPMLALPNKEHDLWYPGDPRQIHLPLDVGAKKRLCQEHGFEEPQLDAFYDQFMCIANVPLPYDSSGVLMAINKKAFDRAFSTATRPHEFPMNAMYDRIFAFYDTNRNSIIEFDEFISGLAYLRGPKRFASLHRALQGFDANGDGYINRADFVRIFRAKFAVQKQFLNAMIESHENEQTQAAMEALRTSQPISSVFSLEDIPLGQNRPIRGKQLDAFGDMKPLPDTKTILDESDPWPEHRPGTARIHRTGQTSPEQLRRHLSRFEEMLYSPTDENRPEILHLQDPLESHTRETTITHQEAPASIRGSVTQHDTDSDERLKQDVLWEIVEAGFSEMLDPIFEELERFELDAVNTREERKKWRTKIDDKMRLEQASREKLSTDNPRADSDTKAKEILEPAFKGEILPTDPESLAQREAEIAQQPLDVLLNATGYRFIESEESNDTPTSERMGADMTHDLTLPQNRPQASGALDTTTDQTLDQMPDDIKTGAAISGEGPSAQRLLYLAKLDQVEHQQEERGGPGRLSYAEIESIAVADSSKEIRGLIKSWLEWASF